MRIEKIWGAAGLAAVALTVAACGSSGSSAAAANSPAAAGAASSPAAVSASAAATNSAASSSGGAALRTATVDGTKVLTSAKGFVLYWFAPDTSTTSKCTGACATYWPPVPGTATAGAGITGTLSTITRPDGTKQASYDGHPLYTYVGDTKPGEAKGNGLNLSGGLWYEMTVSGAKPAASSTASSSSGSGGSGW